MTEPATSTLQTWLVAGMGAVLLYRAAMAALLEAFHALPSIQRRRLLEEDGVLDPLLAKLLEKPHAFGLGISLWNQILLVLLLSLVWPLRDTVPGGGWTLVLATLAYVWAMDLALPTLLTAGDPARWIMRLFPFYGPVHQVLGPLVAPLARYVERSREQHDRDRDEDAEEASDEGVTALLEEGEAEGILEECDRELIRNVVTFGDTVVREVMTPRTQIQGLPSTATVEEAWSVFRASRHSRMPVYEGTIDSIVGVLLLKDLMQVEAGGAPTLEALAKPAFFVPESKNILELLRELQRACTQLALVVDEYGSLSGLVTLEDLLEEVFGEIHDEHEAQAEIQELATGEYLVAGQVHVEDLEARLGLICEREGFDTVAGLVMASLGHVPLEGERVRLEGAILTVLAMEGPRVLTVQVRLTGPAAE